jgi:hypothetical protein
VNDERFVNCCVDERGMTFAELARHTPCRYPYCFGWKPTERQVAVIRKIIDGPTP